MHPLPTLCLTFLISLITGIVVYAQCNTTLNKLLPETAVNNDDRFGNTLDANDRYLVVAAESSDTSGIYYGGAAFVYEKTAAGWAYRAMLTSSDPHEWDFFGHNVAIDSSGNTIAVIDRNFNEGSVYIFEKPATGWRTMHESFKIKFPEGLDFTSAMDISGDGSTIAVSNTLSKTVKLYALRKPLTGWSNNVNPEILEPHKPEDANTVLGRDDIVFHGKYIFAGKDDAHGRGGIYVYKKGANGYTRIATLKSSLRTVYFGYQITATANGVATTTINQLPDGSFSFNCLIFEKNGEWADMIETFRFEMPESSKIGYPIQFTSSTTLATSILAKDSDGFYVGKLIELTTNNGLWQDISVDVLFEESGLTSPSEFCNGLVWNNADLILSASRQAVGSAFRNTALSHTKSAGIWGSLQKVILPRRTSSNVNFGTSIVKTADAMYAGAPYDGAMGRNAGAVYIYDRIGEDLVKVHTLFPSRRKTRPTGGSDAAFGYAIAAYGNEIAVGAPSFLYGPQKYGKIFMYQRNADDLTSVTLYDSLIVPENLELNHVGTTLAMNDHVLFASAYNNFNNEHTNAVVIFEKIQGRWIYKQLIKLGKPIDKSWPSVKFSLHSDQLAVGEFNTFGSAVSIFEKNQQTGKWQSTAVFGDVDTFSGFGSSVKLLDNHLFVGAPGVSYNNVYKSGVVVVFTKMPGESWDSDMEASAIIAAKNPIEGAFFGSSLDVVGNTLAVGAPGMFLTYDQNVRTISGNTYIIQSLNYYWTQTTEYLNLQGDRYASGERDHFGSHVALDQEYFYIGARSEHTSTGRFSGAVYYIPTPPVIFLAPPVCKNAAPFVLNAYPFGGTWTGPGVNSLQGTFDPILTGPGKFQLTYSTTNCAYIGTVEIEVLAPINVQQISPAQVSMCTDATTLKVEVHNGAEYEWYYRQNSEDAFVWFARDNASLTVTNPGEYKAVVLLQCPAESEVFRVALENVNVRLGPQPILCEPIVVSLVAAGSSGVWEGPGVSGNQFNAAGLANGIYPLTYRITTASGCTFALKDSIKINAVSPIVIRKKKGDFCETGATDLESIPIDNSLMYTWFYSKSEELSMDSIDRTLLGNATVYKEGYYQVSATNGDCDNISNIIKIGLDNGLPYALTPPENSTNQPCNTAEFPLNVTAREGTTYIWQYKPVDGDDFVTLQGETTNLLLTRETGFYTVKGSYGFCTFQSFPVSVQFVQDQLFVPNVFTPNGDAKNPVFKVETTSAISHFTIFNRYGQEIYRSKVGTWDGRDAAPGVYFWQLRYDGCDEQKEAKGWVHLVR